jgi:hypothetical protein
MPEPVDHHRGPLDDDDDRRWLEPGDPRRNRRFFDQDAESEGGEPD